MKLINKVVEKLAEEGISSEVEGNDFNEVCWNLNGVKYYVCQSDIAEEGNYLAWLQSSEGDDHLLVVYENGEKFTWEPETYNPAFGCSCIYIGWRKGFLVLVYLEKHDIYICTISDGVVRSYNFHGEEIFIGEDVVSYSSYRDERNRKVKVISLTTLEKKEVIDVAEAKKRGIKPQCYQEYMQ